MGSCNNIIIVDQDSTTMESFLIVGWNENENELLVFTVFTKKSLRFEYSNKAIHGYSSILVLSPPIIRSEVPPPQTPGCGKRPVWVGWGVGGRLGVSPQHTNGSRSLNPHCDRCRYDRFSGVSGFDNSMLYNLWQCVMYKQFAWVFSGVMHRPKFSGKINTYILLKFIILRLQVISSIRLKILKSQMSSPLLD